jgi:GNAT superfamily N-acetyltransferase
VLFYPADPGLAVRSDNTVTLPWPELRLLAVPPDQRGHGIGATLVRECIERARRSGAKILALHTTDIDEDSHAYVGTVELGIRDGPQARTAWLGSTLGWLLLSC